MENVNLKDEYKETSSNPTLAKVAKTTAITVGTMAVVGGLAYLGYKLFIEDADTTEIDEIITTALLS